MRRHSLQARFAPFVEPAAFARVVGAAHLLSARLQPSFNPWGQAWVDLVFSRDGEIALVPFVQIEPAMVYVREASPFIWPSWLPLEARAVHEVEALLEPWLKSHTLLGSFTKEIVKYFTDDPAPRERFEAARAARFLCATPVEAVMTDVGPYTYAARFAAGRRVGIRSPDGGFGAAMLARIANTVYADLGSPARNELARAWYGTGMYGELPRATFDVEIAPRPSGAATATIALEAPLENSAPVELARPVFPLLANSFDPADGSSVRRFFATGREPILRPNRLTAAPVIGGSSGRIALVVRDDALVAPEADLDQARALADALNAQGFQAHVTVASGARAQGWDLIHLFGYRHVHQFQYILADAQRLGVPVVSTPLFDDFANESLWAASVVRSMLLGIRDDSQQSTLETGIAVRRVIGEDGNDRGKPCYEDAHMRTLFAQCRAAIFASASEEATVRSRFGYSGAARVVPCVPAAFVEPEPVGALCGLDEYVLVHAAVEARANQWIAKQACAEIGATCVLVGTVEDSEYYQALLESAGHGLIWIGEETLTPGQLESLYAGARVFADLSWTGHGAARLVRAAAHGTMPVISLSLPFAEIWPGLTGGADPASLSSAAAVLRQAWLRSPAVGHQVAERTVQLCDPLRSLQAVLGAYAEAATVRV